MLSSSRYRTSPPHAASTLTRERSTSRPTVSRTAPAGTSSADEHVLEGVEGGAAGEAGQRPQPALVVGEQQVVAPADRTRERALAFGPAAGRVARSANRSSRRRAMSCTDSDRTRAAASSMASGSPSSDRADTPRRSAAVSASSANRLRSSRARRANSVGRRRRGQRLEDVEPFLVEAERTWLVASTRTVGTRVEQRAHESPPRPSTRCSQLSSSSRVVAPDSRSRSRRSPPGTCSVSATTWARSGRRVDGVQPHQPDTARRRQSRAPPRAPAGSCRPRPSPVTVTSREPRSRSDAAARSSSRPTSGAPAGGRLPGAGDRRPAAAPRSASCCEHLLLEGPQGLARLDAELVDQQRPHPGVRRERVGLPARPVERRDQRRPTGPRAADARPPAPRARRRARLRRRARRGRPWRPRAGPAGPPPAGCGAARPSRRHPAARRRGTGPAPRSRGPATPPGPPPPAPTPRAKPARRPASTSSAAGGTSSA